MMTAVGGVDESKVGQVDVVGRGEPQVEDSAAKQRPHDSASPSRLSSTLPHHPPASASHPEPATSTHVCRPWLPAASLLHPEPAAQYARSGGAALPPAAAQHSRKAQHYRLSIASTLSRLYSERQESRIHFANAGSTSHLGSCPSGGGSSGGSPLGCSSHRSCRLHACSRHTTICGSVRHKQSEHEDAGRGYFSSPAACRHLGRLLPGPACLAAMCYKYVLQRCEQRVLRSAGRGSRQPGPLVSTAGGATGGTTEGCRHSFLCKQTGRRGTASGPSDGRARCSRPAAREVPAGAAMFLSGHTAARPLAPSQQVTNF